MSSLLGDFSHVNEAQRRRAGILFGFGVVMTGMALSGRAEAGPPASAPSEPTGTLSVEGLFGADTPVDSGWTEVLARVENSTPRTLDASLELSASSYRQTDHVAARAAVHVDPGATTYVRLPFLPLGSGRSSVVLRADDGKVLRREDVRLSHERAPFLVLVDGASLGAALRSYAVPTWDSPAGRNTVSPLTLGTPSADRATGDPILPDRAAAYATVSVMLMRSDRLARLQGTELDAVRGWVSGGGALAVVVARPEDLREPNVVSFVGGQAHRAAAPLQKWSTLPSAVKKNGAFDDTADDGPSSDSPPRERLAGVVSYPLAPAARRLWKTGVPLAPAVQSGLTGFAGGALEESDFGATARYGLGEVHLLGFDPSAPAMLDDAWVHGRIVEMVARAWDRHGRVAFPVGASDTGDGSPIRRMLDPNESFRPGLAIAALLLLLYSVAAGPVLFRTMRKRQKPLMLLKWAPALSAGAFLGIVGIGLVTKGVRGRARQLTLVEANAGESRGTARRFRGFYGSGSGTLAVRGSEPGSLLSTGRGDDDPGSQGGTLRLGTGPGVLEGIASAPWQTVVVREDMTASLGASGVSVLPADGGLELVNESGRELRDVLVHVPGQAERGVYFASIASGARVRTDGAAVKLPTFVSRYPGDRPVGRFEASPLRGVLAARDAERIGEVWNAFASATGSQTDFFPEDVPVVLAELAGDPPSGDDSGVRLESSRTLVRIVGWGGAR